ncbi:MAG: crotonyl-CoA carboxylase/reductase [Acidimicrobiia bacterium]|nr:crotonyl-CoA carboxylase/reductase [Acidimicrobiia bacterium]
MTEDVSPRIASELRDIVDAIESDASDETFASLPLPESMRAATVHKDEIGMFEGIPSEEKDPRKSVHIDEVPLPELGPNEALVAVMASAINFNTVWTSIFEPLPTFNFLERRGRASALAARHDLPYHIMGSDAAAVVLRVGPGVTKWKPGDRVVVHCNDVTLEGPEGHDDSMMDTGEGIWGFETNFGGLADVALVKANQLMPKPRHLTWEEAASMPLVSCTAYRMLVGANGARMKQGDVVLIWGATGGLGGFAVQYVRNGGGIPVGVVSSEKRVGLAKALGCERVVNRRDLPSVWDDAGTKQDTKAWVALGKAVRELTDGEDPDIVYEHPGRQTFGASVFVAKRGGTIVTCASTSGFMHEYDNRYLWMNLKRIIGSHFANYKEAWEANRLACKGMVHPIMSRSFPLEEVDEAAWQVHRNMAEGKIGIRVLAAEAGRGVTDAAMRERHYDAITLFQREA